MILDASFVLSGLSSDKRIYHLGALAKNSEKLRMLQINNYRILDSLAHLNGSLQTLMENLKKANHEWPLLRQSQMLKNKNGHLDLTKLEAATRKGVYCYGENKSIRHMRSIKQIPKIEAFKDLLNQDGISQKDYNFAKYFWQLFETEDLVHYCGIYCLVGRQQLIFFTKNLLYQ